METGTEKILLIDDDEEVLDMLMENLARLGYKVKGMKSSIEALKVFCIKPDEFDLVITDYIMPKITGLELVKNFLEIRPSLPVIVCTGSADAITQETLYAFGIKELLIKPVAIYDMAVTIRKVLE